MASEEQLELVARTLPLVKGKGYELAVELYREIFKVDKNIRNLFSVEFLTPASLIETSNVKWMRGSAGACPFGTDSLQEPLSPQAKILANTVVEFATKVGNLDAFEQSIQRICHKHVSRDVRPAHYGVVANCFAAAMQVVFKSDLSNVEFGAWNAAVGVLAGIFIERETSIRKSAASCPGGWEGFRQFSVKSSEDETDSARRLTLESVDGRAVCHPLEGQFACLRLEVQNFGQVYCNVRLLVKTDSEDIQSPLSQGRNSSPSAWNARKSFRGSSPKSRPSSPHMPTSPRNKVGRPSTTMVVVVSTGKQNQYHHQVTSLMNKPGRLVSEQATPGSIVELSVPVGGTGYVDIDDVANAEKDQLDSAFGLAKTRAFAKARATGKALRASK